MKRFISLILLLFFLWNTSYSQFFTDSNLPIVIINTDGGVAIRDDPRVLATMKIVYRGEGLRNYITDQSNPEFLNYDGRITIEIRGSSSQAVPKKQYGFSTKKADNTTNNNISLLGLPKDNDWILYAMAFDASLIRNYLSYNLSRMIGQYASRTVFCEVVINGSYNGLYLLLEKIKSGNNRVDVYEIGPNDITYPGITGGYITKADKTTGGDPVAWKMSSYLGTNDVDFIHELPKPENVKYDQNIFIKSEFEKLATASAAGNITPETGYPSVIDVPSFIDFMIINELAANADAYQFSTYYHKDRNGKLRAGPIWDLDLTYGNDLFMWGFDRSKVNTWQFSNGDNEGPRFWRDLFNNQSFRCYLSKRWNELIQPGQPLNISVIESFIDQAVGTINEAVIRENQRWGTVSNHPNEILKIKTFLPQRITWMTTGMGPYSGCSNVDVPSLVITKIMYNPPESAGFPNSKDLEFIEITNTGNKTENLTGVYFGGTGFIYNFPVNAMIEPGAAIILASNAAVFRVKYGFSPGGQFTRNLSNTGENLLLLDAFGNIIDNVQYSNLPPWPDADGNGHYLELTDHLSDNSLPTSWTASSGTITSVDDKGNYDMPRLYPLPVSDNLYIEMHSRIISLQVIDFQGRLLRSVSVDSQSCILDMSAYSPGLYLIRIITAEANFVRKIVRE